MYLLSEGCESGLFQISRICKEGRFNSGDRSVMWLCDRWRVRRLFRSRRGERSVIRLCDRSRMARAGEERVAR